LTFNQSSPKKSLGQHWLNGQSSLEAMCDAAQVGGSDVVLEIGPGQGSLTRLLVSRAKSVVAVEVDRELVNSLKTEITADNLRVINKDILNFDFNSLPPGYKLVANIPYYLTSHLIRRISETDNPPSRAALLVQKEVAERLSAGPGKMSLLSATAQYYWQVSLSRVVKKELFTPSPKVDSQIVVLIGHGQMPFPELDTKAFFELIRLGFRMKRKTLANNLNSSSKYNKAKVEDCISKLGLSSNVRAQALSLDDWYKLYQAINS
jgi:16S rRNA (adenine1518-N6/adenine1519-N6)-dimethyltransferase